MLRHALRSPAVCALICAPAVAYDYPLDSAAIRTAYFIGTGNHGAAALLARYAQHFPPSGSGPQTSDIEVRTPFAQVIQLSREHSVGYSAQQAQADYRQRPAVLQVRITVLNTTAPASLPPPACQGAQRMQNAQDCFRDFQFAVSQETKLQPSNLYGLPLYDGSGNLMGGELWLEFSARQIASAPLRVEVTMPGGQSVSADFDLRTLR